MYDFERLVREHDQYIIDSCSEAEEFEEEDTELTIYIKSDVDNHLLD